MTTTIDLSLEQGKTMRVHLLAPHTFRIRLREDPTFTEPSLVRYSVLRSDWPDVEHTCTETSTTFTLTTSEATLQVDKADGKLVLLGTEGNVLTQNAGVPKSDKNGFSVDFALSDDEKLYGLGDVTRDRIQKRGFKTMMWVVNVQSYVPIPYVMSNQGWAMLLNTTWRHYFDLGATDPDIMHVWADDGELDYYLFAGEDYASLLDCYTQVAGRPQLLPLWGYALTFVCNQQANAREMLDDCLNFRREGIPCDLVGLEPGWMSKHYDKTVEKTWHPDRFYIPPWAPKGPQTFLGAAERLGFKMSLWLCSDYDLSYEEERRVGTQFQTRDPVQKRHADDFEVDHHLHNPIKMDQVTRPEEPWFQHLRKFVDQGVSAFKMDGAYQVNEHPDRRWGNGMGDEEMHNLYPTLLNKQMNQGFSEHTGRRPMIYSSGGYTGIQQYAATWAGDTGGGPKPLISMLNHGMSGHVNTSCDMDVFTPEGIHFGFLQAWSQVCSWAYWRHPWLLGDTLLPIFKFYARLRYRLLPYLYSMAHNAAQTGMPIMRAMSLVFLDDSRSDDLVNQYMLGDAFLTAAFAETLYLPHGEWIDYWTKTLVSGPVEIPCAYPEQRGGPLYVRHGAIVPAWPVMDYIGQQSIQTLGLSIYLNGTASVKNTFVLYEDDGESLAYRTGEVAKTLIVCERSAGLVKVRIDSREGSYSGMPETRDYDMCLYLGNEPTVVHVNKRPLSKDQWHYNREQNAVHLHVVEEPAQSILIQCE